MSSTVVLLKVGLAGSLGGCPKKQKDFYVKKPLWLDFDFLVH